MDGSRNIELSSSDIVSEVYIDSISYMDLPFEILYDIVLRLPIEDIVRCKSVCKTWYNLIRAPDFISLQANRSALGQSQRILLLPRNPKYSFFLLDNEKCTKIPLKNLELSYGYSVASCCNGLLCIASVFQADKPVFIYNPITGECNNLPKQDHNTFLTQRPLYGFAFDRFSNKYKVVCVYPPHYWHGNVTADPVSATMGEIITEGEDSWRKLELPYQLQFSHGSETVFLNDTFHWMIDRDYPTSGSELILALNINNEKFHTLQLPPVELPRSLSLINFAGSLAFVEFNTLACSSKIWKIVTSETSDTLICEYTCKYVSTMDGLGYYCTVLGLSDRNVLYKATQYQLQANEWCRTTCTAVRGPPCNQLGLYTPENNESIILKMHGSPHQFQTVLFAPTFVSPRAIYFPSKLMQTPKRNPRIIKKLCPERGKPRRGGQGREEEERSHKEKWQVQEIETEQKVDRKNARPSWFTRSSYGFLAIDCILYWVLYYPMLAFRLCQ